MDEKPSKMGVLLSKSQHEGHDPSDPRVGTVEDLAMMMCGACSGGDDHRWQDRDDEAFYHADPYVMEGYDCEASTMLQAALGLGIPIYTGAELDFATDEQTA